NPRQLKDFREPTPVVFLFQLDRENHRCLGLSVVARILRHAGPTGYGKLPPVLLTLRLSCGPPRRGPCDFCKARDGVDRQLQPVVRWPCHDCLHGLLTTRSSTTSACLPFQVPCQRHPFRVPGALASMYAVAACADKSERQWGQRGAALA